MIADGVVDPSIDLSWIERGEALLIVPPWADLSTPSLGVHLLQACAGEAGLPVHVLYGNLALASEIGEAEYLALACQYAATPELVGERFFARAAFDRPPLGLPPDGSDDARFAAAIAGYGIGLSLDALRARERRLTRWIERLAEAIAQRGFPVVGASTTFQQTAASIALLRAVKQRCPETVTMLGGANCEGDMASGILSTGTDIDYVFSGESESSFVEHLCALRAGARPPERCVKNPVRDDMDALPRPDYRAYFEQRARFIPTSSADMVIPYETSRGCWWGQKHHCTFCGLNGLGMRFREKSADKVIADLRALLSECPTKKVWLTDNIMPTSYFRTVLPRLPAEVPGIELFYEEKANLSLEKVFLLRDAGVAAIQPGIEALSTSLLRRMAKGVSAAENVALLRYLRSVGMWGVWNLMYGFPGDTLDEYRETLDLLPLLRHLDPPTGLGQVRIDRFAPYYENAAAHGVTDVQPWNGYGAVFPEGTNLHEIAYFFEASYPTGLDGHDDVLTALRAQVRAWRLAWKSGPNDAPELSVRAVGDGVYLLRDTRGLAGAPEESFVDEGQATALLAGGQVKAESLPPDIAWAVEHQYGVLRDGRYVPLGVATPDLDSPLRGEGPPGEARPQAPDPGARRLMVAAARQSRSVRSRGPASRVSGLSARPRRWTNGVRTRAKAG
ncbi:MAG: RiPP maturation radical SAM C-methyltransferase [Minicystis sp.]